MHPMAGEYDLIGSHPEAEKTIKSIDKFESSLQELKDLISPELQLVETRILVPTKEFQGVLKTIRKTITKREHKVCLHTHLASQTQLTCHRMLTAHRL